jgi:hypothetical protein
VGRDIGLRHVLEIRNGDLVHINAETPRVVGEVPVGRVMRPPEPEYSARPPRSRGERPSPRSPAHGRSPAHAPPRPSAPSPKAPLDAFARRARLIDERGGGLGAWGGGDDGRAGRQGKRVKRGHKGR